MGKRKQVYVYRLVESAFLQDHQADIAELLFGTRNISNDPVHDIAFGEYGGLSYTKKTNSGEGNLSLIPLPYTSDQALEIVEAFVTRVNIAIDSFEVFRNEGLTRWFPELALLSSTKSPNGRQWILAFNPTVKGSNKESEQSQIVHDGYYIFTVGVRGFESMRMHFRPLLSRAIKPVLEKVSLFEPSNISVSLRDTEEFEIWYEYDSKSTDDLLMPHFKVGFDMVQTFLEQPGVTLSLIQKDLVTSDPGNQTGKLLKDEWLPLTRMDRIIIHWTATGYNNSSNLYHFHINGDGKVSYTHPIENNSRTLSLNQHTRGRDYAGHTNWLNSFSIGVTVDAMLGAKSGNESYGKFPMKEIQWNVMAQVVAELSDFYEIPVSRATILSHGMVQETLGAPQANKWDPCVRSWEVDALRAENRDKEADALYARKNFIHVDNDFRNLVAGYKIINTYPQAKGGMLLEIIIFEKTLRCFQNETSVYCRFEDLKEAFDQEDAHLYAKANTNSFADQNKARYTIYDAQYEKYYINSIIINGITITDLRAYRIGSGMFVDCYEVASGLGASMQTLDLIKTGYQIKED